MDYKKNLLTKIERLLSGEWSVDKFRDEYYDYYLEEVPDDALSDSDSQFFGYIQEMLDWTARDPPPEDRQYGWMNHAEFIVLAVRQRARYLRGESVPELDGQLPSASKT